MSARRSILFYVGLLGVSASACAVEAGRDTVADERGPLGKADAIGSCSTGDGDQCGGKSDGTCWCDEECAKFGDCCGDYVAVCEDLDLSVPRIDAEATFDALAFSGQEGLVIGRSVKFVIDARDEAAPAIHFMNANFDGPLSNPDAARFHYFFTREVLGITETSAEFNDVTYWAQDKRYFAGTLQQYRLGADEPVLYAIQFYPQDVIAEATVVRAASVVRGAVDIEGSRLAFVATGQQQTTASVDAEIEALGVENLTLDEVLGALDYIPMQVGEAWGYLRVFPEDHDTLEAIDIPVFDELPLDLTVVAGSITHAVQDASSHINLKSKERGTPNMVLRSAGPDHEILRQFADRPVHLVVAPEGFSIEPSTDAEVRAKLAEKLDKPWVELEIDAAAVITAADDMCPGSAADCLRLAPAFGGKAGNLGFLRHRDVLGRVQDEGSYAQSLGYDVAPPAVGVPVRHYLELVAANPDLEAAIADFVAEEKAMTLSVAERVAALQEIRQMFYEAEFPPALLEAITNASIAAMPAGTSSLKIRSSANAEDIPGFDGAGLYESFRADFAATPGPCRLTVDDDDGELEMKPRTVECAVKGVYASLWNKRAVEERSFARIDHATAAMGLAIVSRYKEKGDIDANSVVVTRVLNSGGVYGYTFSSQDENNVVTNPAPGTHSESVIAAFLPDVEPSFTVTRFAKPDPAGAVLDHTVMSDAQMRTMLDITQTVELAYCEAKPDYYPGGPGACSQALFDVEKPTALDMELKLYEDGEFLCKQVREFAGS
jgi:pyruvate,water dikinase